MDGAAAACARPFSCLSVAFFGGVGAPPPRGRDIIEPWIAAFVGAAGPAAAPSAPADPPLPTSAAASLAEGLRRTGGAGHGRRGRAVAAATVVVVAPRAGRLGAN